MNRAPAGKIILLAIEAVAKQVRAVEDELVVVEEVHHQRRGGERDEARRTVAASVVKTRRGVWGDEQEPPGLPLEGSPRAAVMPILRRDVAVEHEDELLVEMTLGLEPAARRNLANIGVVGVAGN